jgi:hypothetical protein
LSPGAAGGGHDKDDLLAVAEWFVAAYVAAGDGDDEMRKAIGQGRLFGCQLVEQGTNCGAIGQGETQARRTGGLGYGGAKAHIDGNCH